MNASGQISVQGSHFASLNAIHVVSGIGQDSGGPTYSVTRLCESLNEVGCSTRLAALSSGQDDVDSHRSLFKPWASLPRLGIAPEMRRWLKLQTRQNPRTIIHNNGLWMMPNVYSGWAVAQVPSCKLVLSPRGMLSSVAWRRSGSKKQVFWWLFQRRVLQRADCFHATSEAEFADIRRMGYSQPVIVLPNGIDIPPRITKPTPNDKTQGRTLLYLGRIHPIKGLDILIRAWGLLEAKFPGWSLQIAGPDQGGYLSSLESLARSTGASRIHFAGPVYGEDKFRLLRTADLSVLPSLSENFGMTVAEALAVGTPVVVSKGAPWKGLLLHDCGWWVEPSVDSFRAALAEAMVTPQVEMEAKGMNGLHWMQRDFSWSKIATDMAASYEWLLNGGIKPDCIWEC